MRRRRAARTPCWVAVHSRQTCTAQRHSDAFHTLQMQSRLRGQLLQPLVHTAAQGPRPGGASASMTSEMAGRAEPAAAATETWALTAQLGVPKPSRARAKRSNGILAAKSPAKSISAGATRRPSALAAQRSSPPSRAGEAARKARRLHGVGGIHLPLRYSCRGNDQDLLLAILM
eukprot:COSAG01_NODE_1170_length_11406_cov_17.917662_5_plen_174_part_00